MLSEVMELLRISQLLHEYQWFNSHNHKLFNVYTKTVLKKSKYLVGTYCSLSKGAIFNTLSKNLLSPHHIFGFWGWLLTFNIRNRIHNITAMNANSAVDILQFCSVTIYTITPCHLTELTVNVHRHCESLVESNRAWGENTRMRIGCVYSDVLIRRSGYCFDVSVKCGILISEN